MAVVVASLVAAFAFMSSLAFIIARGEQASWESDEIEQVSKNLTHGADLPDGYTLLYKNKYGAIVGKPRGPWARFVGLAAMMPSESDIRQFLPF